jgi:CRISPR-associated protein Csb1
MSELPPVTSDILSKALAEAHFFRRRDTLEPMGGPGAKVFPATYQTKEKEGAPTYQWEQRRTENGVVDCAVLLSVAACSNRFRELLTRFREEVSPDLFPSIIVCLPRALAAEHGLPERTPVERLPHGPFDAIALECSRGDLRFRTLDKTPCTDEGRALAMTTRENATALFLRSPVHLLTGIWDTHSGRVECSARLARAYESEIVAEEAIRGRSSASRSDPFIKANRGMRLDRDASGLVHFLPPKKEAAPSAPSDVPPAEDKNKLSNFGFGAVTPTIKEIGGVTMSKATLVSTLSLARLRQLRFPIGGRRSPEADSAARETLTALGLLGMALCWREGYSLRSRCELVPESTDLVIELGCGSRSVTRYTLNVDEAMGLVRKASARAAKAGLPWSKEPFEITPSETYLEMVRASRVAGE